MSSQLLIEHNSHSSQSLPPQDLYHSRYFYRPEKLSEDSEVYHTFFHDHPVLTS